MNSHLTQSLFSLLAHISLAAVVGSLIYFVFRSFEEKSPSGTRIISCCIIVFVIVFAMRLPLRLTAAYSSGILFGLVGSFFHRKTTSNLVDFFTSFVMMTAVCLSSFTASFIVTSFFTFHPFTTYSRYFSKPYFDFFVLMSMMAQAIAAPLLIWVWKSYRLQPGVDKHLDS